MNIKYLDKPIHIHNQTYELITRNDKWACYRVLNEDNQVVNYELFKRRFRSPHPKSKLLGVVDLVEHYPSDESFGRGKHTCPEGGYPSIPFMLSKEQGTTGLALNGIDR